MPGVPDKFTPFYKRPPGSMASTGLARMMGSVVRPLRRYSNSHLNREVRWDKQGDTPTGWARERSEPSGLSNMTHRFYDRMRRSSDTGQNRADVWGGPEERERV
jgi:hydrogenase small subunit